MKKKFFILLLFQIAFSSKLIYPQSPGPKWENILELADQTVYVDTSSIKQYENQISVLSISIYKRPQEIKSLNKEAKSVKSQILFNATSKKYTMISTLYYDKNLKILGETSPPGFASSSENFSVSIEENEVMTAVYNKAVEYLKSGFATLEQKDIAKNNDNDKNVLANTQPKNKAQIDNKILNVEDTTETINRVALYLNKKDSVQKEIQLKPNPSKKEEEKVKSKEQLKNPINAEKATGTEGKKYYTGNKINPKSAIIKNGSKYSFQVSSWKNKSKAENEMRRLKNKGYNAFITDGYVKGSTWYRVRIGYFDTLEETEKCMKKVK